MLSFLSFLPVLVLCAGRSFANPLSTSQHFSFSSLRVRSTDDDGSSTAAELKSSFDSLNSNYAGATSWTSGLPRSFRWNEATAAQIFSTNTDSDLLPVFGDSKISGTPDSDQIGCRRGKFHTRDVTIGNQDVGEGGQVCSPANAPANGGKPFNSITPPEIRFQPPTGTDQPQNTQPPQKVQPVKDQRTDEEKQNELRANNAALLDEDPMKCRHAPYRIRLDCDGPLGEERLSVFGLDFKQIWNCYPGRHARQQDLPPMLENVSPNLARSQ